MLQLPGPVKQHANQVTSCPFFSCPCHLRGRQLTPLSMSPTQHVSRWAQARGTSEYYQAVKQNKCVACGEEGHYLRRVRAAATHAACSWACIPQALRDPLQPLAQPCCDAAETLS